MYFIVVNDINSYLSFDVGYKMLCKQTWECAHLLSQWNLLCRFYYKMIYVSAGIAPYSI